MWEKPGKEPAPKFTTACGCFRHTQCYTAQLSHTGLYAVKILVLCSSQCHVEALSLGWMLTHSPEPHSKPRTDVCMVAFVSPSHSEHRKKILFRITTCAWFSVVLNSRHLASCWYNKHNSWMWIWTKKIWILSDFHLSREQVTSATFADHAFVWGKQSICLLV